MENWESHICLLLRDITNLQYMQLDSNVVMVYSYDKAHVNIIGVNNLTYFRMSMQKHLDNW